MKNASRMQIAAWTLVIIIVVVGGICIYSRNNLPAQPLIQNATWSTYRGEKYTIEYPSSWKTGDSSVFDSDPVLFCPDNLSDSNPSVVCKLNGSVPTSAPELPNTLAPVALLSYEKYGPPAPSQNIHIWKHHEYSLVLVLNNEAYRDVYTRMVASFKDLNSGM